MPLEIFLNEALAIDLEHGGAAQLAEPLRRAQAAPEPIAIVASHRSGEGGLAVADHDVERLRQRMREELTGVVTAALAPLPMAAAAQRIRDRLGDIVLQSWRRPGQDAITLAEAFADNIIRLSLNARMELTDDETKRLRAWIIGSD